MYVVHFMAEISFSSLHVYFCVEQTNERTLLLCHNLSLISLLSVLLYFYSIKLNFNMETIERTIISQFDAHSHRERMNE